LSDLNNFFFFFHLPDPGLLEEPGRDGGIHMKIKKIMVVAEAIKEAYEEYKENIEHIEDKLYLLDLKEPLGYLGYLIAKKLRRLRILGEDVRVVIHTEGLGYIHSHNTLYEFVIADGKVSVFKYYLREKYETKD